MTKQTFKVGDEVILTKDVDGLLAGSVGTITWTEYESESYYGIRVVKVVVQEGDVWTGHSANGTVKDGMGWNVWADYFEHYQKVADYNPNQQKDEEDDI